MINKIQKGEEYKARVGNPKAAVPMGLVRKRLVDRKGLWRTKSERVQEKYESTKANERVRVGVPNGDEARVGNPRAAVPMSLTERILLKDTGRRERNRRNGISRWFRSAGRYRNAGAGRAERRLWSTAAVHQGLVERTDL